MAKSHYNGDSSFLPPLSEHSGMSGSTETLPIHCVPFPALPAIDVVSLPTPYILNHGATVYIGESMNWSRRLQDHGVADPTLRQGKPLPTTTFIN